MASHEDCFAVACTLQKGAVGPGTAMQARQTNDIKAALRSCTLAFWVVVTPDTANDLTQVHRVAPKKRMLPVLT